MSEAEKITWFLDATSAIAREAIAAHYAAERSRAASRAQWLFFEPGGTRFALVPEGDGAPDGCLSAVDEALPVATRSLSQLTAWSRWKTQGLPHYPKATP